MVAPIEGVTNTVEVSAATEALRYGVVGIIAIVFALVIRYLYREGRIDTKEMVKERKEWSDEREKWVEEREKLRADFERRCKEIVEGYSLQLIQDREASRKREDTIRQESAALIEKVSKDTKDANEALIEMLQKFYEKLVR